MSLVAPPGPSPVPPGRTARRLEWQFLPPHVRGLVEERCGSPVVEAESKTAGYTPGFASVLTCADGSRHFVKAASAVAQRAFAASYREEIRKLGLLPAQVPAPRLLWSHDDDWVVLSTEYIDGHAPRRPWQAAELDTCLDTVAAMVPALTPPPEEMAIDSFAAEFGEHAGAWEHVRADRPGLGHLDEAADLAAGVADVTAGETLVHTDLRDDNLLLDATGRVWLCDWNWPVVGASWLDSLFLLIGPRGDGVDVDGVIASRPLLAEVPADHVDRVLALLAGYFLKQSGERVPPTSPYLRAFQAWQGEVVWHWLAERRGWLRGDPLP